MSENEEILDRVVEWDKEELKDFLIYLIDTHNISLADVYELYFS